MLFAVLIPLLGLPTASLAQIEQDAESDLVARINQDRSARGLTPLVARGDLQEVARQHSMDMADDGRVEHNRHVPEEACCWQSLGENVGAGGSTADLHQAFMASAEHRDNILSPHFTEVGIGVERRGDRLWVTQVFRQPEGTPLPPVWVPPPPPPPELPPLPSPPLDDPPPPAAPPLEPPPSPPSAQPPAPSPPEPAPRACPDATSMVLVKLRAEVTRTPFPLVVAEICAPVPGE